MPLSDQEIREKVIKHDYEFQSLAKSLKGIVTELHEITQSMKNVAVLNEQITNMDQNIKDSFDRVYGRIYDNETEIKKLQDSRNDKGCPALKNSENKVDVLNRAVFGKDGRGGLIFDVEDIKKFMYKSMGAFTIINIALGIVIAYISK